MPQDDISVAWIILQVMPYRLALGVSMAERPYHRRPGGHLTIRFKVTLSLDVTQSRDGVTFIRESPAAEATMDSTCLTSEGYILRLGIKARCKSC